VNYVADKDGYRVLSNAGAPSASVTVVGNAVGGVVPSENDYRTIFANFAKRVEVNGFTTLRITYQGARVKYNSAVPSLFCAGQSGRTTTDGPDRPSRPTSSRNSGPAGVVSQQRGRYCKRKNVFDLNDNAYLTVRRFEIIKISIYIYIIRTGTDSTDIGRGLSDHARRVTSPFLILFVNESSYSKKSNFRKNCWKIVNDRSIRHIIRVGFSSRFGDEGAI